MSFTASARLARDPSRMLGSRVKALHNCLDCFAPFGFQPTRQQLRRITGVRDGRWSEAQVLEALALLEQARESWRAARDGGVAGSVDRSWARHGEGEPEGMSYVAWLTQWAQRDDVVERWQLAGHGDCAACGHPGVLHVSWTAGYGHCYACVQDSAVDDARVCQVPSSLLADDAVPGRRRSSLWPRWLRRAR